MLTFSINTSLSTESTSYPIQDYLDDILNRLEDNKDKLITPRDLRDSMLSLWSSVPFKLTVASGSSTYYVGLDAINPSDRDIKRKILLGKRSYSGTYSYSPSDDVITPLYSSDVDIFLFNTKSDLVSQNVTRAVIIGGTNVGVFNTSPYIQSQIISGTTQSISLDFINNSGSINIDSDWGTVSINDIKFPSISENSASASNNKVLKWDSIDGKLYWDDIVLPQYSDLGTSSESISIIGSDVTINGYSADFSDSRRSTLYIGDISYGTSFDSVGISEMLKRMIYPYLAPTCDITILSPYSSGYVEVGTYPTPTIEYTINKKTLPTLTTGLSSMIPGAYPPITNNLYVTVASQSQGVVISPISATSTNFKITVSDGVNTASASTSITGIYPYFYGFSSLFTMTNIGLSTLTKIVEYKSDKLFDITGSGNLYFIYHKDYGTLSNIYDDLGNTCSGSFSYTSLTFSSPSGLWASEEFYVYQWNGVSQIGPPSVNYQFKY